MRDGVHRFRCGDRSLLVGPDTEGNWRLAVCGEPASDGPTETEKLCDLTKEAAEKLVEVLTFMQLDALLGLFTREGLSREEAHMMVRFQANLADLAGANDRMKLWEGSFSPGKPLSDTDD